MRWTAAIVVIVAGCGGSEPDICEPEVFGEVVTDSCGPIEQSCRAVAERWCCGAAEGDCGTPDDTSDDGNYCYDICVQAIYQSACDSISASEGCDNGGPCVRSSVDFVECNAVLDALHPGEPLCDWVCRFGIPLPDCDRLPRACYTADCVGNECIDGLCAPELDECIIEGCTNVNSNVDCPQLSNTSICEQIFDTCADRCTGADNPDGCLGICEEMQAACLTECENGGTCEDACAAANTACLGGCACSEDP